MPAFPIEIVGGILLGGDDGNMTAVDGTDTLREPFAFKATDDLLETLSLGAAYVDFAHRVEGSRHLMDYIHNRCFAHPKQMRNGTVA